MFSKLCHLYNTNSILLNEMLDVQEINEGYDVLAIPLWGTNFNIAKHYVSHYLHMYGCYNINTRHITLKVILHPTKEHYND